MPGDRRKERLGAQRAQDGIVDEAGSQVGGYIPTQNRDVGL